jgi:hypothetical protein
VTPISQPAAKYGEYSSNMRPGPSEEPYELYSEDVNVPEFNVETVSEIHIAPQTAKISTTVP